MIGVEFMQLAESISEPLLVCDEDLLVVYANPSARALLPADPEWLEDNPADTWIQGPDGLLFPPQGETREQDVLITPAEGGQLRLRARVGPLPVRGAMGWYIQIQGPSALAERLVGMQVVAGTIAQQLSEHLRIIVGSAYQGLQSNLSGADKEPFRRIHAAAEAAVQLQRMLQALDGRGDAQRVPMSLSNLLQDSAPALRALLGGRPLEVDVLDDDVCPLRGDAEALQLMLTTLAQRAGREDIQGVRASARSLHGGRVRLSWLELGPPLSAEVRGRLLEPTEASPFGVSLVLAVINAHGGRIMVDGVPGGTCFYIDLPGLAEERQRRREERGGSETILLVEDDPGTMDWMDRALKLLGYAVLTADNGITASAILRERHAEIDIVLADAVLPGRSGPELLAEARRLKPAPKVMLMSGYSADFLGDQLQDDVPLLTKPFGPAQLAAALRELLDS